MLDSAVASTFERITSKVEIMPEFIAYLSRLGPLELIGIAGFVCYIGAFGVVQFGLMDGNSMAYSLVNVLAASFVGISLIAEFNLASALIQVSWIVIGTVGLLLRAHKAWPSTRRTLGATLGAELR